MVLARRNVSVKAGHLRGLQPSGKWVRRFYVLKPSLMLYSFGSSLDEEPLGCVDVETFGSVRCRDVDSEGRVKIELAREASSTAEERTFVLESAGEEDGYAWVEVLRNESYSRLKSTREFLMRQCDDFAAEMSRLEAEAEGAKERAASAVAQAEQTAARHKWLFDGVRALHAAVAEAEEKPLGPRPGDDDAGILSEIESAMLRCWRERAELRDSVAALRAEAAALGQRADAAAARAAAAEAREALSARAAADEAKTLRDTVSNLRLQRRKLCEEVRKAAAAAAAGPPSQGAAAATPPPGLAPDDLALAAAAAADREEVVGRNDEAADAEGAAERGAAAPDLAPPPQMPPPEMPGPGGGGGDDPSPAAVPGVPASVPPTEQPEAAVPPPIRRARSTR